MINNTKNIRFVGITLFLIGSVAAISMAAKMPEAGADYPTTTGVFIFALIMGIIGKSKNQYPKPSGFSISTIGTSSALQLDCR